MVRKAPAPAILPHLQDLRDHGEQDRLLKELEALRPEELATATELDFVIGAALDLNRPDLAETVLLEKHRRGEATSADLLQAAALAASGGRPEDALERIEAALASDPENSAAMREKILLLGRLGRPREAEDFLDAHAALFPAPAVQSLRESIRGVDETPVQPAIAPAPAEAWTTAHIHRFLELFQGRSDVHARQWVSPGGGGGYNPVNQPLDPVLVEGHFAGRHTLGIYQLDEQARVHWIALDVDIRKEALADALRRRSQWQVLIRQAFDTAAALADLCAMDGIPTAIEYSGFKGYHVWILLARPLPAEQARVFAEQLRARLDSAPPEISVEVFPKQARLQGKQLGNLIKLPLGVHLRSGRRSEFVGADGRPVPDSFEHLYSVQVTDPALILRLLARRAEDARLESLTFPVDLPGPPPPAAGAMDSDLPWDADATPAYQPEADERLQFLLSRCAVLRAVVEKARDTGEISYDEQLALVHTIGHLDNGVAAVNHLLGLLHRPAQELFLKSRLKGNPASCAKLRARAAAAPGMEPACGCTFGDNPGVYPNPLLHLNGFRPTGPAVDPTVREHALRIQSMVRRYLDLREKLRRADAEFGEVEKQVLDLFRSEGVESLPTPMGTLRLVARDDGPPRMVLEL